MLTNQQIGSTGEEIAKNFLLNKGYKIICLNHRTRFGEIDLIAQINNTICFVEVKMRQVVEQGHPLEAITPAKIRSLSKSALGYLQANSLMEHDARFDVVGIVVKTDGSHEIEFVQNAFEVNY